MNKKKLTVVYDNRLNTVPIQSLTKNEMNLFMTICSSMKNQRGNIITLDFNEIRRITENPNRNDDRLIEQLKSMNTKLLSMNFQLQDGHDFIQFSLFPTFKIDTMKKTLSVRVNEDFQFLLNSMASNFTQFELNEFILLKSVYSKNLYRLLKRFRSSGYYKEGIEEFRYKMDVPPSFNNSKMETRVIKVAIDEISPLFPNLKYEKIINNKKISYLVFKFDRNENKENKAIFDNKTNICKNNTSFDLKNNEITTEKINKMKKYISKK